MKVPKSLRALGRAQSGSLSLGVPVSPGKHPQTLGLAADGAKTTPTSHQSLLFSKPPSTSTSPPDVSRGIQSNSGLETPKPPERDGEQDRDVQQDKETPQRHLNTKAGLSWTGQDRTGQVAAVPLLSPLMGPLRATSALDAPVAVPRPPRCM